MSRLEDVVRESLISHEEYLPDGVSLLHAVRRRSARRRRRTWGAAAVALAAVATTAGVLLTRPGPTTMLSTSVGRGVPAGTQPVSFHGVEVFVPEVWKLNDARCGTPQHDTVMVEDGGGDLFCLVPQPKGLTVVRLATTDSFSGRSRAAVATQPVTVDGKPALRGRGKPAGGTSAELAVLVLPDPGVVISVESPDPALAGQLLDSTRVSPMDTAGCVDRLSSLHPRSTDGAASALVPGTPTNASICRYSAGWLLRSSALSTTPSQQLVGILNALPTGVSQPGPGVGQDPGTCEQDAQRGFVVPFTYSDDTIVKVYVHIGGCKDLSASNGARTTKINEPLVTFLTSAVGYDGGFPNPRELR
jgi:hypothetical protein